MAAQPGIAVIVDAEIVEERLEEFKELIKVDAIGSREEPGCLRFDVLQDMANPCRFFFYEAYVDAAAVGHAQDDAALQAVGRFQGFRRLQIALDEGDSARRLGLPVEFELLLGRMV